MDAIKLGVEGTAAAGKETRVTQEPEIDIGDIIDAQTLRVFNIKLLVWSFLMVRWITELERRVREGFKGAVINGHNQGRYLDNQFYWPILECAEALNVPIYLHPTPLPQPVSRPPIAASLRW